MFSNFRKSKQNCIPLYLALSSKSHKRRLKYADQEWSGSTDSQLSSDPEYPSPK